ncbi:hypothetical protein ACFL96_20380 [Thermoproteota archaeon]
MAYISQSGSSGTYIVPGSQMQEMHMTRTEFSSIDIHISRYSKQTVSTLETAAEELSPTFFDTPGIAGNPGYSQSIADQVQPRLPDHSNNNYSKSDDVDYAINSSVYSGLKHQAMHIPQDNHFADIFLNRNRPASRFIGSSEDIRNYVEDAFEKTTGKPLPDDFMIRVVPMHELRELHEEFGGAWNPGIQGFSVNKKGFGQSIIVCKENDLDRLLVTIGHEIGHIINFPLSKQLNEEAKAFAFEMVWLKKMHEHNIAGLRKSINPDPNPAKNGLHDVAFNFVKKHINNGKECFEIMNDLMMNKIKVRGDEDAWM